jgi:chromosome segregation ATPase
MARKLTGMLLATMMVMGIGMTAFAAETPATPAPAAAKEKKVKPELTPEQQAARETLKSVRGTAKDLHDRIVAQREELKGKLATIKQLFQSLKADPKVNKEQIVKARAAMNELKAIRGDIKGVNEQLKAKHDELKAAIQAKNLDAAIAALRQIITLQQTKLDLFRTANGAADQVIVHLKAAAEGKAD